MKTSLSLPAHTILITVVIALCTAPLSYAGKVAAWGLGVSGETTLPNGLDDVRAIAAGGGHCLVLRSNGSVLSWGGNRYGQSSVPGDLTNVLAIAAGLSHSMALRADNTVVDWGGIGYDYGQTNVPPGLRDVKAISAGEAHGLALRADGTVVSWGRLTSVPPGLEDVVAIAAGYAHNLALKTDGSVVAWGYNYYGATDIPANATNVVAIAAGQYHSLALKGDGTVVGWGRNSYGEVDVPAGLSNVVAISGGSKHSLALKADGEVVGWGNNDWGQANPPEGLSEVTAIDAGGYYNLVLGSQGPPLITGQPSSRQADLGAHAAFSVVADGVEPLGYQWFHDGTALSATNSLMIVTNLEFFDAGAYIVVVSDRFGSVRSMEAMLTVIGPPSITQHPESHTVVAGTNLSFSVTAAGTPPLTYQWFKADELIEGVTQASFTLSNVQPEQAGSYFVVVSNAYGSVSSSNAVLNVDTFPASITTQPIGQVARVGRSARFRIQATGAPLTYQWFFEGGALHGQSNSVLELSDVSSGQTGIYFVTVSNLHGLIRSSNATLTVFPPSSCAPTATGAVAWWPGESNTWDVIGGFDGAPGRQPPQGSQPYTNGLVGTAFRFTQSWFMTVPFTGMADLATGEGFTFEAWMNPDYSGSRGAIAGWGPSHVRLQTGMSAELLAYLVKTNGQTMLLQSAPAVVQTSAWQHVALTCDHTTGDAVLYMNGSPVAQTNIGPGALRTSGTLNLGSTDGRGYSASVLDEPALYARALSQAEIQSIYLADSAGKCPPSTPPTCTPASADVVAWWPGQSNTWDVAGEFNASFGPPTTLPPSLTYSNGLVGTAFRFQTSWQLTVPAAPELDLGKGDGFTFETWLNPDSVSTSYGIFGWGGMVSGQPPPPVPQGVHMTLQGGGELRTVLIRTNNQQILLQSPPGAVVARSWQHVALTCNTSNGQAILHVNGRAVATLNGVATGLRTAGPLSLGSGMASGSPRFSGLMDEPTLYSRALAQSEIRSIYEARRYGKCPLPPRNCQVAESDIAGWWRGESNALDSATTNHGVMQPNNTTPQYYTNGVSGTAFALRYGNHVVVPGSASLDVGSGSGLTVEAWVNPFSISVYPIAEWNSGTGTQGVYLASSVSRGPGYMEANLVDDQGQSHLVLSPLITPVYNQWRHVAVSYDKTSGAAALFVDGTAVTLTNLGSFTPRTTGNLYLGYRPPGNYPGSGLRFNGFMDEVAVYRRALSPAEIRCLIVNGDAGKYPPLAECVTPAPEIFAWWRGESNLWDSVISGAYAQPRGLITYTNGRFGKAIVTGTSGYLYVRMPPGMNVVSDAGLAFEGWIHPNGTTPSSIFAWFGPGVRLDCNVQGTGSLRADLRDTNGLSHYLSSAAGLVQTGRWQHVALTYDNASGWGSLYLNGNPVVSTNLGRFTPQATGNLAVGGPATFDVALDEIAIYQRALTSFEIAAIYRSANGRCTEPPTILRHPESLRVNAGSDVLLSVEAVGNPLLRYRWFKNGKPMFDRLQQPITNTALALTNVTELDQGVYHAQVTNAFGTTASSNALLLVNYPPIADASATRTRYILPPCTNAVTAVLDGSLTTDPDQDPLTYQWLSTLNSQPSTVLATGLVAIVSLSEGVHPITLIVDDGLLRDTSTVTIEVLSTATAIDDLIVSVKASSLKTSHKMVMALHLRLAQRFLERDNCHPAVIQLEVFKCKVRHWVEPRDPALAAAWTAEAQAIIDASQSCCGHGLSPLERLLELVRASELPPHLRAILEAKLLAAIEASNRGVTDAAAVELGGFIAAAGTDDTGEALASAAQEALSEGLAPRARIRAMASPDPCRVRLEFSGTHGGIYIVEASADMQQWTAVGVARETAGGTFEFEQSTPNTEPCRFYRILMP